MNLLSCNSFCLFDMLLSVDCGDFLQKLHLSSNGCSHFRNDLLHPSFWLLAMETQISFYTNIQEISTQVLLMSISLGESQTAFIRHSVTTSATKNATSHQQLECYSPIAG